MAVQTKLPKILPKNDRVPLGETVSRQKGQLITIVCCMSDCGKQDTLIFPRKRNVNVTSIISSSKHGVLSYSGFIRSPFDVREFAFSVPRLITHLLYLVLRDLYHISLFS
jgi:hypothetical protein